MSFEPNDKTKFFIKEAKQLVDSGKASYIDIANSIDWNSSALSNVINERRNIPNPVFSKFTEHYKINYSLQDDEAQSEMSLVNRDVKVIGKEKSFTERLNDKKLNKQWEGVPMYDAPISASFVETYRDEKIYHPRFYLLDDRFRDCDFGSIIRGDSMHSEIRHGDFVVCKEVTDFGFLVFGEIYFFVSTNDLETCKYLHPGRTDDEFMLKAYNKSIPPTPLPKNYVKKLYKVRGILRAY